MNKSINRRELLKYGAAAAASAAFADLSLARQSPATQRTIIIMFDGFGPGYLAERGAIKSGSQFEQWDRGT